jgi:hypothetical protein
MTGWDDKLGVDSTVEVSLQCRSLLMARDERATRTIGAIAVCEIAKCTWSLVASFWSTALRVAYLGLPSKPLEALRLHRAVITSARWELKRLCLDCNPFDF